MNKLKPSSIARLAVTLTAFASATVSAQTWNFEADYATSGLAFASGTNPSPTSPWSLLFNATNPEDDRTGRYTPMTGHYPNLTPQGSIFGLNTTGYDAWWRNGSNPYPMIGVNLSGSNSLPFVPAGSSFMLPGSPAISVLRWTAPSTMTINVAYNFTDLEANSPDGSDVYVCRVTGSGAGTVSEDLFAGFIEDMASTNLGVLTNVTVNAGDRIDWIVGTGGLSNVADTIRTFAQIQPASDATTNLVLNVPAGNIQTQREAGFALLTAAPLATVRKTGPGTVVFDTANTLTGPTTVSQGTLELGNAGALSSSAVTVAAGATLSVGPQVAAVVPSLVNNGLVDVGLGGLTITAGQGPATLVAAIVAGRNDGTWDGTTGITSSAAATQSERAVGWLDNGDGSFTVAFAAAGDWNVNGTVDFDDVVQFVGAGLYDTGLPATWAQGDYDYSGTVDFDDVLAQSAAGLFDAGPYNAPPPPAMAPLGVTAVPEPSGAVLAALAIGAALACRPRQSGPRAGRRWHR